MLPCQQTLLVIYLFFCFLSALIAPLASSSLVASGAYHQRARAAAHFCSQRRREQPTMPPCCRGKLSASARRWRAILAFCFLALVRARASGAERMLLLGTWTNIYSSRSPLFQSFCCRLLPRRRCASERRDPPAQRRLQHFASRARARCTCSLAATAATAATATATAATATLALSHATAICVDKAPLAFAHILRRAISCESERVAACCGDAGEGQKRPSRLARRPPRHRDANFLFWRACNRRFALDESRARL